MMVIGETTDGRKIIRTHGGTHVETVAERDQRIADEAAARLSADARKFADALLLLLRARGDDRNHAIAVAEVLLRKHGMIQ